MGFIASYKNYRSWKSDLFTSKIIESNSFSRLGIQSLANYFVYLMQRSGSLGDLLMTEAIADNHHCWFAVKLPPIVSVSVFIEVIFLI